MSKRQDLWWGVIAVTNTISNDARVILPRIQWRSRLPVNIINENRKIGELHTVEQFGALVMGAGYVDAGTPAFGIGVDLDVRQWLYENEEVNDEVVQVASEGFLIGLHAIPIDEVPWRQCVAVVANTTTPTPEPT